jgi:protein O-GlcNAc transferase
MCGQPLTTGNPLVQWYISDRVSSPAEYQAHYHEHLSLLPTSYLTNSLSANSLTKRLWHQNPPSPFPPTNNVGRVKYGLAEEDVVLAYFGQIYKIDSSVFAVWVRVLRRVARAKLWLFHFPIQGYIYIYIHTYIYTYIYTNPQSIHRNCEKFWGKPPVPP